MDTYFIDYDLRNSRDYKTLYEALEKLGAVRVLESQWALKKKDTSASELRDYFKELVDSDDGLSVVKSADWATYKAEKTPNKIKK